MKKSFINGAVILMAAGFIVRIFGFFYRIYLSNLIGAEGMGLFQLISPVYSLVVMTLTSGVSIAVSRMVAREAARGNAANTGRITVFSLIMVLSAGVVVSVAMMLKLDWITDVLLKDHRTYYAMLFTIPCIPVVAAASALKGYFYGVQEVMPTAISQVTEQIVRIGLVIFLASKFIESGLEYACALAMVAMAFGEIANLLVLIVFYKLKRHGAKESRLGGHMRKRKIVQELLSISVPVSSNRFVMSVMSAVEVILIPRRLVAGGMAYQSSIELYGKLTGMAMPLLYFPSLVTSSIAITLVPAISEAMSLNNVRSVNIRISKAIQISLILGFLSTAIFLAYPDAIGNILYRRETIGWILHTFSFSCVFLYLHQTLLGVLNGLGKQGVSLRNSIIGYIIRIGFVYFLIPLYGINSYLWGITVSYAVVCILDIYAAVKCTGMVLDIRNWLMKPGLTGLAMWLAGPFIYSFFTLFVPEGNWATLLAVAGNLVAGLALMTVLGVFDRHELLRIAGIKGHRKNSKFYENE